MPPAALKIEIDHAQRRIRRDRLATLLDGNSWGQSFRSNCYVDPITGTGMLIPSLFDPQWSQTSAGRFARIRKSEYSLGTPSAWVEFDRGRCPGDYYLHAQGTNEPAIVSSPFERNRGVFLSLYNYSVGNETRRQILDCGWTPVNSETPDPDLGLRFYSDGDVEIWRNGRLDGYGDIRSRGRGDFEGSQQGGESANRSIDIMILPFRRREVLVVTNQGGGFSHVLQDIAEDDDDPTIHDIGQFFWQVHEGKATVQCAKATFAPSGYLTAVHSVLTAAPETGETPSFLVFADLYGGEVEPSLVLRADPDQAFIPDDEATECRIRVDLTGITGFTPNLYGVQAAFDPIIVETPDEAVEIVSDGYVVSAQLDVPANPTDAEMRLTINKPDELEFGAHEVALLKDIENRPVLVSLDDLPIIDAWGETPSWILGSREEDRLSQVSLSLRDSWQRLHEYIFSDPTPLDSMNLSEAFEFLAKTAGFDESEIDIDPIDFDLPTGGTTYEGEFVNMIRPGDRASDWWEKLHSTYCPLFFYGVVPTATGPMLKLKDNTLLSTEPDITIYATVEEAKEHLIGDPSEWEDPEFRRDFAARVFRKYREESIALETNEIWVQGYDHREEKPILCRVRNEESQDPELAKGDRPKTWLGTIRKYAWTDPTLTTQEALIRAARVLCKRLFPRRYFVEWESEFLLKDDGVPIWRGDVVELFGKRVVRVISLSGQFRKEPIHDVWYSRPFRYMGEVIEVESKEE